MGTLGLATDLQQCSKGPLWDYMQKIDTLKEKKAMWMEQTYQFCSELGAAVS